MPGRTDEQDAFRRARAERGEPCWLPQELRDLFELFPGLVNAGDVLESCRGLRAGVAHPRTAEALKSTRRSRLAEPECRKPDEARADEREQDRPGHDRPPLGAAVRHVLRVEQRDQARVRRHGRRRPEEWGAFRLRGGRGHRFEPIASEAHLGDLAGGDMRLELTIWKIGGFLAARDREQGEER